VSRSLPIRAIVALCAIWFVVAAAAQSADSYEVTASIQPDQGITESQTLRLVVKVDGTGSPEIGAPPLTGLVNLQIVGGPDRRLDSVWRNGRFSSTSTLVYTLLPGAAGPAEIPALTIQVDGRPHSTEPIRFEVSRVVAGAPPRTLTRQQRGRTETGEDADVFIRSKIGSTEVWAGESVPLTVSLYTAERVTTPSLTRQPSLSSFWVENIDVNSDAESYKATVEGRRYLVYPLVRKVLVPQTSGRIEIEPFVMQIPVQTRGGGDMFDFFSFSRNRPVVRKTQPLVLNVRPLPSAGRPDDFGGAVGSYKLRVSLDRQEADVNEALALTASVEGEGLLRAVQPPVFDVPPDLKVFDPKVGSTSRIVQGKMTSRKTWEWVLVPLTPGELKLPEVRFPFFDTATGRYVVARQQPPSLVVRRGAPAADDPVARGDIQLQRRDLAFIRPLRGELDRGVSRVHDHAGFLALLFLPLAWVPLVILAGRHRARLQENLGLARSRKARSRARKRLRAARDHLRTEDGAGFHEEVARALVEYVADRFDRSGAGLTYEIADELLTSEGLDLELRRRFLGCLETCDFARFVPASGASERREEVLDEAVRLVDLIEKAL